MRNSKLKPLSKSKLMLGFQCPKNLWLSQNEKNLKAPDDEGKKMQFAEGNEVGVLARTYAGSEGVLIKANHWEYQKAHDLTQEAIKSGARMIFEASFLGDGLYARADILKKGKLGWHLIEVKKSTSVKNYHIQDAAIQAFLIRSLGLKLESVSIMFINNSVTFPDLEDLFEVEEITSQVDALHGETQKKISQLKKIAVSKVQPKVDIGPQCAEPFECDFKSHCWKAVPQKSVFELPGVNATRAWALYNDGKKSILDLTPEDFNGAAKRAIQVTKSKKVFIDKKAIKKQITSWKYPLYFFDFETIGPAIP